MLEVKRELKLASPIVKLFELPAATKDGSPQQVYTAMIRAVDLVKHDWQTDPNARNACDKSKAFKGMQETLYSGDGENFALYNNGIDILVSSLHVENWGRTDKTQDARIIVKFFEYTDGERSNVGELEMGLDVGGIINGGHTFNVLKLASEGKYHGCSIYKGTEVASYLDNDTLVKLTFFVNLDDQIRTDVAKYRNTSKEVADFQLSHMEGSFKHLDKQISSYPELRNIISFKGNEASSSFTVEDIIQRVNLFDIKKFPFHDKYGKPGKIAATSYTSKGSLSRRVAASKETSVKYLYPLFRDMLSLEDHIRELYDTTILRRVNTIERELGHNIDGKLFNNPKVKKTFPGCKEPIDGYTSISGRKHRFEVPLTYIFPILSSFRFLVNAKGPHARWIGTPTPDINMLWKSINGNTLISNQLDYIRDNAFLADGKQVSQTELGKNKGLWRDADGYVVFHQYYSDNKV